MAHKEIKKAKDEFSLKDDISVRSILNGNNIGPVSVEEPLPKQPDSSLSQKIHITGNYYWDAQNRTLYYKDKKLFSMD